MRSLIYIDDRIKSFWHCRLIKFEPQGCQGDCWPFCISGVGLQGQSGSSVLRPGPYLTQVLWAHSWNLRNIYFIYIGILMTQIMSRSCTCHDSSAVVACAKLWPDLVIIFQVRATRNFTRLNHGLINPLWNGPQVQDESSCCVHNASTVPWTSAGQFGRPRGVRGRPWYDLWRPRCVISHPMDVRGLPPGRPPSGRPRDTQFGIDWSLLPSGCPQGVRTAEVQPITARTHYGQEVGLPTVRPKPEVDVP